TRREQRLTPLPHFVVVLDGYTPRGPLGRLPALATLLQAGSELGVTVLCLASRRGEEPPVLQARLEWAGAEWITYEETGFGGRRIEGVLPDQVDSVHSLALARELAPLRLGSEAGGERDLAQDVRLVQLVGLASPDEVDPATEWRPRLQEALLRVPIGIGTDGAPLLLDIKEAAEGGMGPHGLLIGATGSGKSELLRTIVTSMAMGHDPEVVSFLLADFKGGASFADLAGLPHTAGMITNIESDLTLVDRMRASLFGEQERRQKLLRQAGNLDNIQQYWATRRLTPALDPMPHLLIVVDEFAELLTMRPDFLDLFVAIGRVGRSLGMHLLLATQRLGEGRIQGLEGHLRYRICLRTFSAAESSAVIGTPDAFYLPSIPGLGYFKVDSSVYRQFKTATVSSPYRAVLPADGAAALTVRHFTESGQLVPTSTALEEHQVPGARAVAPFDELSTDMDVVIARLRAGQWGNAAAGQRGGSRVHQVCLPPLPAVVSLETVLGRGGFRSDGSGWAQQSPFGSLRVPLGLLDVPAEQRQDPLVLDFAGAGGHVALVGAPQSGKSLFLQTLVLSLALTHSPRDVQIYCVDLGGGGLHRLADVPHVGAVCGKLEREKLRRLLRHVRGVIEEREVLFRQHGVDSIEDYRAQRRTGAYADQPYGDVFLVVDDLGQLLGEIEQAEGELAEIVASGLTYGVHLVLTARRWV
ncbi:MAG TPA: FtsK/SpoIIIE domain-containing protein, partial [Ktedonobacterales bacterium]|nr:FtsK/SpoIIIE domain-containing protein [Ktedonobacterales bacterium]